MPSDILPIQNINNSYTGFLFGSGNAVDSLTSSATYPFIIGKGNSAISGMNANFVGGMANKADYASFTYAFGVENDLNAQWSFVFGSNNAINNKENHGSTFTIGHNNATNANCYDNHIIGHNNSISSGTASSYSNYVFGNANAITGMHNEVFGYCSLSGSYNFIYSNGSQSNVVGDNNRVLVAGPGSYVSGNGNFLAGHGASAMGNYSTILGYCTKFDSTNNPAGTTVVGIYNATTAYGTGSPKIFIIGNGSDESFRSDAMTVSYDGTVSAAKFINSAGEIPALIPTASQPAGSVACTIYSGSDGKFYIKA